MFQSGLQRFQRALRRRFQRGFKAFQGVLKRLSGRGGRGGFWLEWFLKFFKGFLGLLRRVQNSLKGFRRFHGGFKEVSESPKGRNFQGCVLANFKGFTREIQRSLKVFRGFQGFCQWFPGVSGRFQRSYKEVLKGFQCVSRRFMRI